MQIEHDRQGNRFVLRLDEGDAELAYVPRAQGVLDLVHTFVPPPARGRGIGASLVRHAFGHARENGLRLIPTCPFVRAWLAEHPEERDVAGAR